MLGSSAPLTTRTGLGKQLVTASRYVGLAIVLVAILVLFGWGFDIAFLKSVGPGLATMKINTAIGFLITGAALYAVNAHPATKPKQYLVVGLSFLAIVLGSLTLFEYLAGVNLGIDEIFLRDLLTPADAFPGRMSGGTALCLVLSGLSLFLFVLVPGRPILFQVSAFLSGIIATLGLIGYLFDVEALYHVGPFSSMALHTALLFAALSAGILLSRPARGVMRLATSEFLGGVVFRKFLPLVLLLPILVGWFSFLGEGQEFYDSDFRLAITTVVSAISLGLLTWVIARNLDQADRERQRMHDHANQQTNRIIGLRQIDIAISTSIDLTHTLEIILKQVIEQLSVDAAVILLLDHDEKVLEFAAGRGFRDAMPTETRLPLGESYAGRAALENRMISLPDLTATENQSLRRVMIAQEGFKSYYGLPLSTKNKVTGVLEVFHRDFHEADKDWVKYFETLGGQAAIAIDNAQLVKELQISNRNLASAYDATIEGWAGALDLRDEETQGHSRRVTEMTVELAGWLGITDELEIESIRRGALLHDIGKMAVPDNILHKPDTLDENEWHIMRQHPQRAFDMLKPFAYLRDALDIPYAHHEKWDGSGYPRGLSATQIPISARIFAVVDVWDALNSDRPYRKAWPENKVLTHIKEQRGIHFDPQVVDAFLEIVQR